MAAPTTLMPPDWENGFAVQLSSQNSNPDPTSKPRCSDIQWLL